MWISFLLSPFSSSSFQQHVQAPSNGTSGGRGTTSHPVGGQTSPGLPLGMCSSCYFWRACLKSRKCPCHTSGDCGVKGSVGWEQRRPGYLFSFGGGGRERRVYKVCLNGSSHAGGVPSSSLVTGCDYRPPSRTWVAALWSQE